MYKNLLYIYMYIIYTMTEVMQNIYIQRKKLKAYMEKWKLYLAGENIINFDFLELIFSIVASFKLSTLWFL